MSDATIIKPRPGGRGGKPVADAQPNGADATPSDKTVVFSQPSVPSRRVKLPSLGINPLVDEAGSILSLIAQIRSTTTHSDVDSFRQACIDKVRDYENSLRRHSVTGERIEAARYCLCSFLDEAVLNTPWGGQSVWGTQSLLSTFHAQTWGGEYFYTLLDSSLADPQGHTQLLELQYLCLSLGFVGKMRVEERGNDKLEDYRERSFQALRTLKGEPESELSGGWRDSVLSGTELHHGFPLWVIGSVFGLLLLSVYMGFSYSINEYSNKVFEQLNGLAPWEQTGNTNNEEGKQRAVRLQQILQTEVGLGIVNFTALPDRLRVTMSSSELFSSGSAEVREAVLPILSKIARAFESTEGRILITGHTDNQPIFTSKYPSNWHLSLARATSVANVLAYGADLHGRLWPEGRGDSEPRADNDNDQNRALNRRVEIDLLY